MTAPQIPRMRPATAMFLSSAPCLARRRPMDSEDDREHVADRPDDEQERNDAVTSPTIPSTSAAPPSRSRRRPPEGSEGPEDLLAGPAAIPATASSSFPRTRRHPAAADRGASTTSAGGCEDGVLVAVMKRGDRGDLLGPRLRRGLDDGRRGHPRFSSRSPTPRPRTPRRAVRGRRVLACRAASNGSSGRATRADRRRIGLAVSGRGGGAGTGAGEGCRAPASSRRRRRRRPSSRGRHPDHPGPQSGPQRSSGPKPPPAAPDPRNVTHVIHTSSHAFPNRPRS